MHKLTVVFIRHGENGTDTKYKHPGLDMPLFYKYSHKGLELLESSMTLEFNLVIPVCEQPNKIDTQ